MAEPRIRTHAIMLSVNSKKIWLELFPADAWPEQGGGANLYRVRIDGRWHSPMGKYSFLALAAVGELAASLLAGGVPVEPAEAPGWLCKGAEVRACYGECSCGLPESYRGYALDEPQFGPDGRWYVLCHLYGKGARFIPADDVEPLRR